MPEVLTGLTFSQVNPDIYEQYRQTRDAEMFEQLVFDYMLNKHSDDQELKDYIMSLPRHQKRTAIVSVIDGDNNLWNQLHSFIENCPDKLTLVKNIIHIINKFVKDGEVERKKYGEVMTPISLVKEMLDTLPKEVWSNPNLKWLDPANGAGTFPFVVIYKLMNGLAEWEPNAEKRYKHIVENMIYTCELQSRNVILWLLGVDPKDEYTTNTYWGSFLDEGFDKHMKEVWGIEKFDIIIGNPPYNQNGSGTGNTIWNIFVEKSSSISKKNLLFIHPSSWRMPLRESDRFFKSSQIIKKHAIFIRIIDKQRANDFFGLSVKVDFYVLDLSTISESCVIESPDGSGSEMNIKDLNFIPNDNFDLFKRLLAKKQDQKCEVVFSYKYDPRNTYVSRTSDDVYRFPLILSTPKSGIRYAYSSVNNRGHFGIPKVIFGESGIGDVIIDINGDYGMTQGAMAIIVSDIEEASNIKKALLSNKFNDFLKTVMWSNFRIDWRLFSYLKKDFWKEFIVSEI